ncbi:MAG: YgiQ family radical SAM protein, partial [Proteobacteria bacterium]|nr:YgiQ family radical SAM protein [Pseudomonadota bacterium]
MLRSPAPAGKKQNKINDAYVDHPSFGAAVIGRVLEHHGFRVGIIAQPDWRKTESFRILGRPRLFFGITSGNTDSMVANYTANKRPRKKDDYSPGGTTGLRPDRAVIVYANRVREAYKDVPIVLGGIEASMRRLAHYDYWDNAVRRSILVDARGDMLVYGMGETQVLEIARKLGAGARIESLDTIRGTVVIRKDSRFLPGSIAIPSYEEVKEKPDKFNEAVRAIYVQQNPFSAKPIVQRHGDRCVIHFPPPLPVSTEELDTIYELPYLRDSHPAYSSQGGVKALETVRFSLIAHRGCCGECSFCSLSLHQGRIVQSRSRESLVREARLLSERDDFRGTITDIGGPTANLYAASCRRWQEKGACENKSCLTPAICKNLKRNYNKSIELLRSIRELPGINHAFIGSGLRYDLLTDEGATEYLEELCSRHISGQMKVAPEHSVDRVLALMNKPPAREYEKFVKKMESLNRGREKKCYLVNYFISAHPGATLADALRLAQYFIQRGMH